MLLPYSRLHGDNVTQKKGEEVKSQDDGQRGRGRGRERGRERERETERCVSNIFKFLKIILKLLV